MKKEKVPPQPPQRETTDDIIKSDFGLRFLAAGFGFHDLDKKTLNRFKNHSVEDIIIILLGARIISDTISKINEKKVCEKCGKVHCICRYIDRAGCP